MVEATGVHGFPSSHWSLVAQAGAADCAVAHRALADLCRRYWYPVYAYIRRHFRTDHEAEDLTQGFFTHLLQTDAILAADPSRGRFRSYLLTCCRNYLANTRRAAWALKKGGGIVIVGLDFQAAAARYAQEPADPADPEAHYLRRWAITLLEETFATLEGEYRETGQGALFTRLRGSLAGDPEVGPYAETAVATGMTEAAVKKSAQRLRERFGDELRRRVGDTVADPAGVADEIRDLFAALR